MTQAPVFSRRTAAFVSSYRRISRPSRRLAVAGFVLACLCSVAVQSAPLCQNYGFNLAPDSFGGGPGQGGFSSVNVGLSPLTAVVGNFNGDRWPDIATANFGGNNVTILLGNSNSNGNFTQAAGSPVATPSGGRPWGIAVGRFNADQHLDLAVANRNLGSVSILLGTGTGQFTLGTTTSTGANQVGSTRLAVGDLNGDGRADVAVPNEDTNRISVLLGDGNGALALAPASPFSVSGMQAPNGIAIGRFVGNDTILDLAVSAKLSDTVVVVQGNGSGGFTLAQTLNPVLTAEASPRSIETHDMNADGIPDLVVANFVDRANGGVTPSPSNTAAIFRGLSAGGFSTTPQQANVAIDLFAVTAADMDLDGKLDLVGTNAAFTFAGSVALQNASGAFDLPTNHFAAGNPFHTVVGDFDDNGAKDFAVVNQPTNTLTVFLNTCTDAMFKNGYE